MWGGEIYNITKLMQAIIKHRQQLRQLTRIQGQVSYNARFLSTFYSNGSQNK
jgi:hypothetical protein